MLPSVSNKESLLIPIIYHLPEKKQYLYDATTSIDNLAKHGDNISIPLVMDTEYTGDRRMGITVQVKGIDQEKGVIFDHKDLQQHACVNGLQLRHEPIRHDFAVLDYLSASRKTHAYRSRRRWDVSDIRV